MSKRPNESIMGSTGRTWLRRNVAKLVIVAAAIVVLVVIMGIPAKKRDVAPAEAPPVNVTVMTVSAEPEFADTFDLPAVVEPNRIVQVCAEVAGRIDRLPIAKGSIVRAGDLFVLINQDLIRPDFDSAQAQFERDRIELERVAGLVKSSAAPTRDLDNASTALAISKSRLEGVKARLDRTRIVAPSAGTLNDLLIEQGEYVQAGTALAELVQTDTMKVVVDVPERDTAFFSVGHKAVVFVDFKGQETSLTGTISFISALGDQKTRSTRTEITVDNKDGVLRSGQIVRARLMRRLMKDAILIPLLAVIPMENGKAVYVVNSAQAQRREIELGIIKGDRIQVTRGLSAGERLIISGHRFVAPGQGVKVISEGK